jgi:hypothetical protein
MTDIWVFGTWATLATLVAIYVGYKYYKLRTLAAAIEAIHGSLREFDEWCDKHLGEGDIDDHVRNIAAKAKGLWQTLEDVWKQLKKE